MRFGLDQLQELFDRLPDPVFVKDSGRRYVFVNQPCCTLFGAHRKDIVGKTDGELSPQDTPDSHRRSDESALNGTQEKYEVMAAGPGVEPRTLSITKTLFEDPAGNRFILGITRDITELRALEKSLRRSQERVRGLAISDGLTRLYNRRGFLLMAEQQLRLARRNDSQLVLIYARLDGLHGIESGHGNKEGDRAIQAVAGVLKRSFRDSDLVCRLEGGAFAILAIDTSLAEAEACLRNLQTSLDEYNQRNADHPLELSTGIVPNYPKKIGSMADWLEAADRLMRRGPKD